MPLDKIVLRRIMQTEGLQKITSHATDLAMTSKSLSPAEADRFAAFNDLQEQLFAALAKGQMQSTVTLDTMAWIDIIQEIKGRNPRNFSQLLRDDQADRMESVIERLHEEITYLAIMRPGSVAKKLDPDRPPPPPRMSGASDALRNSLKGRK